MREMENESSKKDSFSMNEDLNSNIETLKNAISKKLKCVIYYKGEEKGVVEDGFRTIEPYAIGVNEVGNNVLRAWIVRGKSKTGKIDPSVVPGWRLFRIDRIYTISLSLETFTVPHKGYNEKDSHMVEITYSAKFDI